LKKALALSALPLALLFGAAFQSSNSVPAQLHAILSEISDLKAQVASSGPRKFYLTKTTTWRQL
jgi:outer membrane lipoprotein-sorting protein